MGRIAAYLGPRVKAASVVETGSRSLVQQAAECPDGFGIGWYPGDEYKEPVRQLSSMPIWTDQHLLAVPRRYTTECAIASVRSARGPSDTAAIQPLQQGRYLFCHDGELDRFAEVYLRPLRERLSPARYAAIQGHSASELLFHTWLEALGDQPGQEPMANALEAMVSTVQSIGAPAGANATFAVVVSDGECLVSLRTATQGPPPALYTIVAGPGAPLPATGRVIASEPIFPGAWSSLDPHSLVIFTVEPQ